MTEPGGSGAGSTVDGIHVIARKEAWEEWVYDHDALGRSRLQSAFYAGWVACTDDLRAALEAAQGEIERLNAEGEHTVAIANFAIRDLAQSRATEAELRTALGQVWSTLINQMCVAGSEAWKIADDVLDGETKKQLVRAELDDDELAALDAAEQPARAEGGQG